MADYSKRDAMKREIAEWVRNDFALFRRPPPPPAPKCWCAGKPVIEVTTKRGQVTYWCRTHEADGWAVFRRD